MDAGGARAAGHRRPREEAVPAPCCLPASLRAASPLWGLAQVPISMKRTVMCFLLQSFNPYLKSDCREPKEPPSEIT